MSQQISVDRFLSAVKPNLERLQAFYRNCQFKGTSTRSLFSYFDGEEVMNHSFRSNGLHLRLDSSFVVQQRDKTWAEWARVATPFMGFHASRGCDDASFYLKSFSKDPTSTDIGIRWRFPFVSSTYQFRDMSLWEFLTHPLVQISKCWTEKKDRQTLVQVECQMQGAVPQAFAFSVDKAWAMVDFWTGAGGKRDRVHVDYEMVGDYPIVRRYESFCQHANESTCNREVVEVTDFVPAPAPIDAFDLSAFGIHDTIPTEDFNT